MRISFDEPTGDAILAAILAAEWWQESDFVITAKFDASQLSAALTALSAALKDAARIIGCLSVPVVPTDR